MFLYSPHLMSGSIKKVGLTGCFRFVALKISKSNIWKKVDIAIMKLIQSGVLTVFMLSILASGCEPSSTPVPPTIIPSQIPPTFTATPSADAKLADQIDTALSSLEEQGNFSGSALIARDGEVLLSRGYGLADRETNLPNTPSTKFHIGSLTKQFTAMAILILQNQGKLNVQDPICNYIENCPQAWQNVTIHQLMIHTSGIHEINDTAGIQELVSHPATPFQIIAQFRDLPLDFEPGTTYSFSSSGYMLLGSIIESVSGQTYATFIQENIFDPLQMKNSGYDDDQHAGPDHAVGYKDATTLANFVDKSIPYASGGLYSTVEDLLLWDQALYNDELIPTSLQVEMFTPFISIPSTTLSSGYGWNIGTQFDQPWYYYGSLSPGFTSRIHRFPDAKVTIIILSNRQDTDIKSLDALIAPMIFGGVWVPPTS
jgi:CubicO group peptidase (beta-lactamase class C family)